MIKLKNKCDVFFLFNLIILDIMCYIIIELFICFEVIFMN